MTRRNNENNKVGREWNPIKTSFFEDNRKYTFQMIKSILGPNWVWAEHRNEGSRYFNPDHKQFKYFGNTEFNPLS